MSLPKRPQSGADMAAIWIFITLRSSFSYRSLSFCRAASSRVCLATPERPGLPKITRLSNWDELEGRGIWILLFPVAAVRRRCRPLMALIAFSITINSGNGREPHISGQSLPDLVWWHDESFKGRHDSFCTMNTGAASVFLQSLAAHFWSPPNGSFGAV